MEQDIQCEIHITPVLMGTLMLPTQVNNPLNCVDMAEGKM
jgi:hypothetical protein